MVGQNKFVKVKNAILQAGSSLVKPATKQRRVMRIDSMNNAPSNVSPTVPASNGVGGGGGVQIVNKCDRFIALGQNHPKQARHPRPASYTLRCSWQRGATVRK